MISQNRYIDITSGVGAGANVAERALGMRVITQSPLIPPGIVMTFANSDAVESIFGAMSEEYARALAYENFISKQINKASQISFSRWVASDIAPSVVGDATPKNLAALKLVNAGTLTILSAGVPVHVTALSFTAATNLTDVAAALQTAIRLSADSQLTTASVTYNTNTGQFVLTGSVVGSGTLSVALGGSPASPADVAALVGWGTTGAVNVPGQSADTPQQAAQKSAAISNNFGSFVFVTTNPILTIAQILAIAQWNSVQNNQYVYSVARTITDFADLKAAVGGFSGTALHLLSSTLPNDFVEQCVCEIAGATDYDEPNSVQNYMYYQFPNRNTTVMDDTTADLADSLLANYIGVTQENGQALAFYQRGVMCGGPSDALDMNTYVNEIWLKSTISAAIMRYFLAVGRIPANETGQAAVLAILQTPIDSAKTNGVISAGKTLDTTSQQFITQISNSPTAWRQVATIGYWLNVTFSSYVNPLNSRTEWKATYTLIYSKDDVIRFVEGRDILI